MEKVPFWLCPKLTKNHDNAVIFFILKQCLIDLAKKPISKAFPYLRTASEAAKADLYFINNFCSNRFLSLASKTTEGKDLFHGAPERSYGTTNLTHKRFMQKWSKHGKNPIFELSDLSWFRGWFEVCKEVGCYQLTKYARILAEPFMKPIMNLWFESCMLKYSKNENLKFSPATL